MKQINYLGGELNSGWQNVTAQERVNCYLEITSAGEKQKVVAYGTPGTKLFCDLGNYPVRGGISVNDAIYCVVHSFFYRVDNAGTATQIGSISTESGFVSMAFNGTQILIVDGSYTGYLYTLSTVSLAAITDADYPALRTCCFVDGYFVGNEINTGKYYISALYDGASWNALDFASAESNPDNIERTFEDHGGVMLLGTYTTEIVGDNGGQDFPFARIGYPIEWGLMAFRSVAKLGDHTCFLARNRMGESQVVLLSGYTPRKVSTPDLESILAKIPSLESATAFAYMQNGHQFYQLNTADGSFLYDMQSDMWSTVKSHGIPRHLAEYGFNLVNRIIVSDYRTGKLYTMSDEHKTDNGDPIQMEIVGRCQTNSFDRMAVHELQVDCEVGDGMPQYDPEDFNQYWDNIVLLLNFENADQTTFSCQKTGRLFTTVGGANVNMDHPQGGYPALNTMTGGYIYAATDDTFATGKDPITLDVQFYIPSASVNFPIFDTLTIGHDGGRYTSYLLYINAGVPTLFSYGTYWTFGSNLTEGAGLWNAGEWANLRLSVQPGTNGNNKYVTISINGVEGSVPRLIGWDITSINAQYQGAGGINVNCNAYSLAGSKDTGYIRKFVLYRGVGLSSSDGYRIAASDGLYIAPEYDEAPQIMMQTSKDFGHTWGTERWCSLGKVGEYLQRARWSRLGRAYGFTFKLKISDPIRRAIIGVYMRSSK